MENKIVKFKKELESKKKELQTLLENNLNEMEKHIRRGNKEKKGFTEVLKDLEKNFIPIDSNLEDLKEYYSRMVLDIKELKLLSTDRNPTKKEVDELAEDIDVVISCRSNENAKLYPAHVGNLQNILKGTLDECRGKNIIVYIHGYNVNRKTALIEANSLFKVLKREMVDYKFILFTWPGDAGLTKFDLARSFAEYSGELLYKITRKLKQEYSVKNISIIAHSLGSQVALRSANLMGNGETYKDVLLLGPAIDENILSKDMIKGKYWYPDSLDHIGSLNVVYSKTDIMLEVCFSLHELGKPLGSNNSKYKFDPKIQIHDLTPMSCQIKEMAVHSHLQYWETEEQIHFYKNLLFNRV